MNKWWFIALLVSYLGVGYCAYTWRADLCKATIAENGEAQQKVTINAQASVITTIGKQQDITQGVENAHHTGITAIDRLYATAAGVQPPADTASGGMPTVPTTTGRPDVTTCKPSRSKYYRLDGQECDDNTEQLIELQTWVHDQATSQQ